MSKRLYVGNLSWGCTEDQLKDHFGSCGTVVNAKIITDRETGRSRGFAFVEMTSEESANNAIQQLNGKMFDGRQLKVSEAQERAPKR